MLLELHHLSASNINKFITNRSAWFASYFLGHKFTGSKFTERGKAVEHGVCVYIEKKDITVAIEEAVKKYKELTLSMPEDLDFIQSVGPLVKVAIEGTDDYMGYQEAIFKWGEPTTQDKLELFLPGCSIPVIGYLDFMFKSRIWDNKVSSKTPSELSQDYIVQGSLYHYATKLPVEFHFQVPNKKPVNKIIKLTEEQYKWGIALATKAANAIEFILDNPVDMRLTEAYLFPDPDGGYFKDEQKLVCEAMGLEL